VKHTTYKALSPDHEEAVPSTPADLAAPSATRHHAGRSSSSVDIIPAFDTGHELTARDLRVRFAEACTAWLGRSPSRNTRENYLRDLQQFMVFVRIPLRSFEQLATVRPYHVAAWRDRLREQGLTNNSIRRKMTVLRSLF
jgi:hypothetical protein